MHSERSTSAIRTLEARAVGLDPGSQRDPLTGLYDRAWFDQQLTTLLGQTCETGDSLTVILADVDGLGAINRAHGDRAGDRVIASVAARLARRLRARDLVARHAGAAFAVLLARAPAAAGRAVAERLRAGVADEQHEAAPAAERLRVTISIGCVTLERGGFLTRQQLMEKAARALAAAKRDGRDRVVSVVDAAGESLDRSPHAV